MSKHEGAVIILSTVRYFRNTLMVGCYAVCSRKRRLDWRSGYCHFPPNSKIFIHTSNMAAASSDFTQCFSNLKLGSSGEETERSERFWNASTVELNFGVERMWLDAVWKCRTSQTWGCGISMLY